MGTFVERELTGERDVAGEKLSVPLCPPQMPHELTWLGSWAVAVSKGKVPAVDWKSKMISIVNVYYICTQSSLTIYLGSLICGFKTQILFRNSVLNPTIQQDGI
jgi:hypothetical protein